MKKPNTILLFISLLSIIFLVAFALAAGCGPNPIPPVILITNALQILITGLACALVFLLGWWFIGYWKSHPSYNLAETGFTLFVNNVRKARAQKNAAQIILPLQVFFYGVLARNQAVLGLNPGADYRSLSPNGKEVAFRNGCIYYRYELIVPSEPEQELDILQRLMNQFISAELANYGITNLPGHFTSSSGVNFPSVYLDRLTYDFFRHTLVFELLFVSSNNAATALARAWERDLPKVPQAEPEVFDDEV